MNSSSSDGHRSERRRTRTPDAYRLVRTGAERVDPPVLDAAQRAVVEHTGGPLLVLAGPGTGKTTTLVEAVAARVEAGADPARVLILTFSRKAAVELRDRTALRLGGARAPQATTFHSFCYGLVRSHQDAELFADPLRLLSGPEQDVMVRTLLEGQRRIRSIRWPDDLRAALTTRGFADEVRAVLARARELGLGPAALSDFATRLGRPDWKAAAAFLSEYLDVLDLQGTLDYAELLHRAVLLAERTPSLSSLYDVIYVDEYQDTDASQLRLLRALAGPSGRLTAFGDPDQSIYAFRGADINNILDFETSFPGAQVHALTTSRRSSAVLLTATRHLTTRMQVPRLPSAAVRAHRALASTREGGRVEVFTYPTAGAELDNIADILRRAHLEEGVPWQDMAVLVRAGGRTLPQMRRALIAAGVPAETDGTDAPLRHEPAIAPLLTALRTLAQSTPPPPPSALPGLRPTAADGAGTGLPGLGPTAADGAGTGLPGLGPTAADGAGTGLPGLGPTAADGADTGLPGLRPTAADGADTGLPGLRPTAAGEADTALPGLQPTAAAEPSGPAVPGFAGARAGAESELPDGVEAASGAAGAAVSDLARDSGVGGRATSPAAEGGTEPSGPAVPGSAGAPAGAGVPSDGVEAASGAAGAGVGELARNFGAGGRETSPADEAGTGRPAAAEAGAGLAGPAAEPDAVDGAQADGVGGAAAGEGWIGVEAALVLLSSPLGGMDAADLRRLGRALRDEERAAGARTPAPSDVLLARALAEPERLVAHDPAYARGAQRLGLLLRKARELLAGGGTAEEVLWTLWDGTPWPQRLERSARRGGPAGRNADRDLDAVCALFDTAARAEERTGGRGALNFLEQLEAEDIAGDTLTPRATRREAVRLMTAHRSKGLEWGLVVVAGVQEGLWPDLRRRGSLLEADRIGRDGLAEPLTPGALLAEERRLFYVAATRARDRLVVTAVKAPAEDGDQPSRLLAELGVPVKDVTGRPRRPLAVPALVAELRSTTVDPDASPALRDAAARRLARLAVLTDDEDRPLVPAAHPQRWWGLYEPTRSSVPLRDRDHPVALSGSALEQLANTCSLQWFLGREVKADAPSTAAQGFGNVVHVLADEVASGRTPADLAVLMERLDSVWDSLAFDAPWKSRQEKDNARAALERFLRWHTTDRGGRAAVATEHDFDVTLEAGEYAVRVRGSMDRVEADAQGRAYVVDFKTGKSAPTAKEVERHPQLAVYQLAVREGAVDEVFDGLRPAPGGAELVQLRQGAAQRDGGDTVPKIQAQQALEGGAPGEWVGDLLATAAGRVLDERFAPVLGKHCDHCSFRASCSARPEGRQTVE
ncbi:UvrD-helicase domain-containing protein [Streptomyces sp. NBC_00335]|uniref:UvrD-helicase domain-containing protein n=1 Tax=unclassified Streptomyces TaxID=2593676 RepID=UPI00225AB7B6|nr:MULTISPECIES: UvrD-helicase domain-containing protein [unclassified Streptomyces]MCX5404755.1 UvrD-helicase domain-containing protein [Streptomyces sp. NBC_00086]